MFLSSFFDWTEADMNASLKLIVRKGQNFKWRSKGKKKKL